MSSFKDMFLSFFFTYFCFLARPRKTLLFLLLQCCLQLFCQFWTILPLVSNPTDTIINKYKTQWGGGFVFISVSSCILNVIVTFRLSFSSKAEDYATIKLHSKRKLFLEAVIFTWIFFGVYKLCHFTYQYINYHQSIFAILIGYSNDYLLFRLEITVLYLGLRIENLALRFDVLSSDLELWLPLEEVEKINGKLHMLINEIQEMSKIAGQIIFLFCLRCVGAILTNFYSLIFVHSEQLLIKLVVWYSIKQITNYFVS